MDPQPEVHQSIGTSVGQVPMDRLHSIFDGMFDGVWLVAANGRTTYANEAMAGLLGSTPDELNGRPMTDFLDRPLWAEVDGFLARQQAQAGERISLRLRRTDGTDLFAVVAGSPIQTAGGAFVGTMLNVSDVTGKRSIDAQIVQNQRLEAVGQFAGGIAHDFNNLLTSIHGFAELARANLADDDVACDDIDQVLNAADRASALIRKLLAFTRRQVLIPVDIDPAQVIADLAPILKPLLGDDVHLVVDVAAAHSWIRVDPTQLEQVLVNLAVNARDAMPAGGSVTFTVQDLELTDPDKPDADMTAGPFVRISVSDTGSGMDDATRARIFDPFYTTKGVGKGTGLGLSTVFGIVTQSGGQVQVESTLGAGSTFHVDMPRVDRAERHQVRPPVEPSGPASGVVLLVEDDPAVREVARRALEQSGYWVLVAAAAEEALRISHEWDTSIQVLVTDIVMPGTHGPDLANQIRAQRPDIGLVFMSGFADDIIGPGGQLTVDGEFLTKPFTVAALTQAVRRAASVSRLDTA